MKQSLDTDFEEYGLEFVKFFVLNVRKPEDDPHYKKFKELHFRSFADIKEATIKRQVKKIEAEAESDKIIIESSAMAQKRAQEGYTYQQEKGFDVAKEMAKNEATGQYSNMWIGLGMMAGVGGTMAGVMGNALGNAVGGQNPPPVTNQAMYHVALSNGQTQQITLDSLKDYIIKGLLTKETLCWKQGMANWEKASEILEIKALFNDNQNPPPLPN